jgi:hypothetical protein
MDTLCFYSPIFSPNKTNKITYFPTRILGCHLNPIDGEQKWERSPLRGRLYKDLGEATIRSWQLDFNATSRVHLGEGPQSKELVLWAKVVDYIVTTLVPRPWPRLVTYGLSP